MIIRFQKQILPKKTPDAGIVSVNTECRYTEHKWLTGILYKVVEMSIEN